VIAAPPKFAPRSVTMVPPAIGPSAGAIESMRGCCANAAAHARARASETRMLSVRKL
jgi:hypothetical protein